MDDSIQKIVFLETYMKMNDIYINEVCCGIGGEGSRDYLVKEVMEKKIDLINKVKLDTIQEFTLFQIYEAINMKFELYVKYNQIYEPYHTQFRKKHQCEICSNDKILLPSNKCKETYLQEILFHCEFCNLTFMYRKTDLYELEAVEKVKTLYLNKITNWEVYRKLERSGSKSEHLTLEYVRYNEEAKSQIEFKYLKKCLLCFEAQKCFTSEQTDEHNINGQHEFSCEKCKVDFKSIFESYYYE